MQWRGEVLTTDSRVTFWGKRQTYANTDRRVYLAARENN